MWSRLRQVFWLALLASAGCVAYCAWQRRSRAVPVEPPVWPHLIVTDERPTAHTEETAAIDPTMSATGAPGSADDVRPAWVPPDDGLCPDGYPIKVNVKSGIFHVPGGRFYTRAVPERCYANEASAEADGYRRAKA